MTLPPKTPIGKYVVRKLLAVGGMGEVYLAYARGPEGFEKEVVIKRIRSYLAEDAEFVKMFVAEARLASLLNHPNVVQIFDFDKHEDTFYLAMEYVPGHSLLEVQKRRRELSVPLTPVLIAHVGAEVARGLHYAHLKTDKGEPLNLVHRDCTPHNVLLSFDGAVKLADFGVAKASNKSTAPGSIKGKYAYMSPEQSVGDHVDARSDVFTLGIVLWELLTGVMLFDDESEMGTLRAVRERVIADPTRLNSDVPKELGSIVMKALERDLSARYQTAQQLEWALSRFAALHADSDSARDVGAYLRGLFAEEGPSWGAPKEEDAPESVMDDADVHALPPLSPDEDPNGTTAPRVPAPRDEPVSGTPVHRSTFATPAETAEPALAVTRVERSNPGANTQPAKRRPRVRAGLVVAVATIAAAAIAGTAIIRNRNRPMDHAPTLALSPEPATPTKEAPPPVAATAVPTASRNSSPPPVVSSAAPAPNPSEKPESSQPESPPETKKNPTVEFGSLLVRAKPWAYLYIDSKSQGLIGGSQKFKLPSGAHRLRFENSGHSKEMVVHVPAGRTIEQSYVASP